MPEIKIVFNVLCNKTIRINRLEKLVKQLIPLNPTFFSIRLRGEHAQQAELLLRNAFEQFDYTSFVVRRGDTYKSWKMNSIEQVIFDGPRTPFIGIFQEDFQIMAPLNVVQEYIDGAISRGAEAIELLPGPYFGFPSPELEELKQNPDKYTMTLKLSKLNILKQGRIVHALTSWPAVYDTSVLLRALASNRPYFKKFHPDFPFDWEKSVRATWLLPLTWHAPKFELLACIDYDSLWQGSSLQSRGLMLESYSRGDDTVDEISRKTLQLTRKFFRKTKNLESDIFLPHINRSIYIKHKFKRSLIYFHGIRFSFLSFIWNVTRINERQLKKLVKSEFM